MKCLFSLIHPALTMGFHGGMGWIKVARKSHRLGVAHQMDFL